MNARYLSFAWLTLESVHIIHLDKLIQQLKISFKNSIVVSTFSLLINICYLW